MLLYLFLGALLFAYFFYHMYYKRLSLPPGPVPWPFLGNLLGLRHFSRIEQAFVEYRRKYGDVFTFWFSNTPQIVLTSLEMAEKYMVKNGDVFTDRMEVTELMKLFRGGDNGIINSSGELWKNQRRFALKVMRDFGMGKSAMEEKVLSEVLAVIEKINKDIDAGIEEINVREHINVATGSIINVLICGESFTAENKEDKFYEIQACLNAINDNANDKMAMLSMVFPRLLKVPYIGNAGNAALARVHKLFGFTDAQIDEHLKTNDYSDQSMEPRDFIDAFMLEKNRLDNNGEDENYFTNEQLKGTVMDLWMAGHDTTSATINWIIAFLITYPAIQKLAHEELDRVISSNRPITTADRQNLPYVNAIINESQRTANVVPLNIARRSVEDIEIEGYHIKKGTLIVAQVSSIMQDEEYFPQASTFKPERFIDKNGKFLNNPAMLPFSLGKRACLGEGLARMELFLFTANLLNQLRISSGKIPPSLKKIHAAGTQPEYYNCKFEKRLFA